jgi:hypothetical protein
MRKKKNTLTKKERRFKYNFEMWPGSRVVSVASRPEFDGFGFTIKQGKSENGPHRVASTQSESPCHQLGLRPNDLILGIDETKTDGLTFAKVCELIDNALQMGLIKLEVTEGDMDSKLGDLVDDEKSPNELEEKLDNDLSIENSKESRVNRTEGLFSFLLFISLSVLFLAITLSVSKESISLN